MRLTCLAQLAGAAVLGGLMSVQAYGECDQGSAVPRTFESHELFTDLALDRDLERLVENALTHLPAKRYRVVEVDSDRIRQTIADVGSDPCVKLVLPLFDDLTLESIAHRAKNYHSGNRTGMSTWLGFLSRPGESVGLVIRIDGRIELNAHSDRSWYRVISVSGHPSAHVILEVDRARMPEIRID